MPQVLCKVFYIHHLIYSSQESSKVSTLCSSIQAEDAEMESGAEKVHWGVTLMKGKGRKPSDCEAHLTKSLPGQWGTPEQRLLSQKVLHWAEMARTLYLCFAHSLANSCPEMSVTLAAILQGYCLGHDLCSKDEVDLKGGSLPAILLAAGQQVLFLFLAHLHVSDTIIIPFYKRGNWSSEG